MTQKLKVSEFLNCSTKILDQFLRKILYIQEMDKKEIFSKSLLANILDIDDNFCASKFTETNGIVQYNHPNGFPPPNGCFNRQANKISELLETFQLNLKNTWDLELHFGDLNSIQIGTILFLFLLQQQELEISPIRYIYWRLEVLGITSVSQA